MGVANLTMMATQAVAVAVRAVGASHQKSCGDPNQQVGAIITNITGIHLISYHIVNHGQKETSLPACGHDQIVGEYIVEDVVHELGSEHNEPYASPILDSHDANSGKIPAHLANGLLCDRGVGISTLLPPHLGKLLLHHDPAVAQSGSNISSVKREVGKEKQSPGPGVDEGPWKHEDSTPGHLPRDEDGCHPDSHPLGLHHLLRVHGGDDDREGE